MAPKGFPADARGAHTLAHWQKPLLLSVGTLGLAHSGESGHPTISFDGPGSDRAHARSVLMFILPTSEGN